MFCNNNSWISDIVKFISDEGNVVIDKDLFNSKKYDLIITGTIGVGKSTILQFLSEIFKYNNIDYISYPEFITYEYEGQEIGQKIFEMKMKNIISTFTFQNYILDIWNRQLIENDFKNSNKINLFERIPYDAVYCFSKKEYENGNLSKLEFDTIIQRYEKMSNEFNLYNYDDIKCIKVENNNSIKSICEIIKIITDDLKSEVKSRCICLKISEDDEYYNRLNIRNREGEDKYKMQTLENFRNYYDETFKSPKLNEE